MPGVTNSRRSELVREVCLVLQGHPEGLRGAAVLAEVAHRLPPTEHEAQAYERNPNVRRYEKVIRFASINVVKAGWLVKDQGTWTLTDDGAKALERFPAPEPFYLEAKRLYREWVRAHAGEVSDEAGDDEDAAVSAATTLEEAEESASTEIERFVGSMPPYEFQALVEALLTGMGYYVDFIAPPGRDQGIDLIAYSDALGVSGPRIMVQVKRRPESRVDAGELRSFLAVLGDSDVGIYVAAGGFTSEAAREARTQERRRLILVDLKKFVRLWVDHQARLDEADRRRLPLRPVYFLTPPD